MPTRRSSPSPAPPGGDEAPPSPARDDEASSARPSAAPPAGKGSAPAVLARPDHPISRRRIDPDAVWILYRLHRAGHIAHLVGGSVRDLLVGVQPKDFDIGTDAHPRQIRRLFHRCFLIGRRFRLAHVHRNGKIFEVSTFRSQAAAPPAGGEDRIIRRDNTFGTPEEDAKRRDFTINGLFYDIATFRVIDWVGGLEDLQLRRIRMIGDPRIRIPEDPVRILRAAKFSARLDFTIDPPLRDAMRSFARDLLKCAKARIFVELNKILVCGASAKAFRILREVGALRVLLPELDGALEADEDEAAAWGTRLETLDRLPELRERFDAATLMAVLLAPLGRGEPGRGSPATHGGWRMLDAEPLQIERIRQIARRCEIPKAATATLLHVLQGQRRIHQERSPRMPPQVFAAKTYFPDVLLFTELEVEAGMCEAARLEEWRDVQEELSFRRRRRREGTLPRRSPRSRGRADGRRETSSREPGGPAKPRGPSHGTSHGPGKPEGPHPAAPRQEPPPSRQPRRPRRRAANPAGPPPSELRRRHTRPRRTARRPPREGPPDASPPRANPPDAGPPPPTNPPS